MLDASGNEITDTNNVGIINPFRYRGYFYDRETNLYYLKSRYYDPEIGRFLNMDSIEYADPETINGLNLYAYCNNNPVMNVDPDGHGVIALLIIIGLLAAGAVTGGVVASKAATSAGKKGGDLIKDIILGTFLGLAASAAIVALSGVALGAYAGATATFLGLSAKTIFAIGAVTFDAVAFLVAPIFGITMNAIEYETPKPVPIPQKPQPTPPHPYTKRKQNLLKWFNNYSVI